MTDTPEAVRLAALLEQWARDYAGTTYEEDTLTQSAALLRRIPELEAWKAKVIKAAEEAHGPGAFRFKMSLNGRGTASNVFPKWLDQRWVSFVYAEDDAHIGLHARIAQLEAERDQLRAELERVRSILMAQPAAVAQGAGEVVAWLWKYIGRDPYAGSVHGAADGYIARSVKEMNPENPPYPDTWKPVHPLTYAYTQPAAGADVLLAIATVRESYRGTDWGKVAECICDAIDAAIAASGRQE